MTAEDEQRDFAHKRICEVIEEMNRGTYMSSYEAVLLEKLEEARLALEKIR